MVSPWDIAGNAEEGEGVVFIKFEKKTKTKTNKQTKNTWKIECMVRLYGILD